jgi:PIN like domain
MWIAAPMLGLDRHNHRMHGLYDGDFVGFKIASSAELDAALREAVVAVDANVLLDLYRFRRQTSRDLIKTFRSLGDRLVVPHQALLEFWRRRQRAEDSPGPATKAATELLGKLGQNIRDALNKWARAVGADQGEVCSLITPVNDALAALKGELESALHDASAEGAGDPILGQLEEILAGRVTPPLTLEQWDECVAEGKRRIGVGKPPGYMDAEKEGNDLPEGGAVITSCGMRQRAMHRSTPGT